MVLHEARAREMAKIFVKFNQELYDEPCLSFAKNAAADQKKEIEDYYTKRALEFIKKDGIQKVEVQFKLTIKSLKLMKEYKKAHNLNRTNKGKKTTKNTKNTTCKYNKKTGSYTITSKK